MSISVPVWKVGVGWWMRGVWGAPPREQLPTHPVYVDELWRTKAGDVPAVQKSLLFLKALKLYLFSTFSSLSLNRQAQELLWHQAIKAPMISWTGHCSFRINLPWALCFASHVSYGVLTFTHCVCVVERLLAEKSFNEVFYEHSSPDNGPHFWGTLSVGKPFHTQAFLYILFSFLSVV